MTAFAEDVLVVGGGIGGLSAALALARAGRRVHVVEQAERFAEIGAGLQLGPNAVRAFDQLGVLDVILLEAVLPPQAVIRDAVTGETLTQLDFGASFRRRYQYPYVVAHRHDVLSALLAACQAESGITLETGRAVTGVREGVAAAEAAFGDGSVIAARLLVGADGIHSRVRRLLDDSPPRFSGHVAYRGTVSRAQVGLASDDFVQVVWEQTFTGLRWPTFAELDRRLDQAHDVQAWDVLREMPPGLLWGIGTDSPR